MTVAYKTILEQMAAGDLEHIYAQAVISVDKNEIVWDGTGRREGSIAVYSRNNVEPAGTIHSLHPAIVVKENSFRGNTTLHYELIPGKYLCQEDRKTDGILLCYNGGEYVIPIHLEAAQKKQDSEDTDGRSKDIIQETDCPVNPGKRSANNNHREKEARMKLARLNLERLILCHQNRKPERQSELLEQIISVIQQLVRLKQDCIRYKLYEAAAVLESGNVTYAAKQESRIRNVVIASKKQYCTDYCILLYLQYRIALAQRQLREAAVRKQQLAGYIQNALEKEPADQDLVLLLCSDCLELETNAPLDLWETLIYAYQHGNASPYLFFYGACLLENPQMERLLDAGLDSWIGHCLYFGVRNNIISKATAGRASQCRPESYTPYICCTYEALYKQYPSKELLSALCTVMIRCDMRSDRAFTYYEKAVEAGMKIARLYDYYMYTLPSGYDKPVSREILLYFSLDMYVNPQIYTRILLNVVQFYSEDSQICSHYGPGIQAFVRSQIMRSSWSEDLAVLAGEILTPDMVDAELAQALIPMLYLVQVKADVPDGYLVVFESGIYKEPQTGTIKNGKTCLCVPGGNGRFHLQDRRGKAIKGVNLKVVPLMQDEELMNCCEKLCPYDETLSLMKTHAWITQNAFEKCDFRLCMQYLKDESLDENFRKQLLNYVLMRRNENRYENTDIQILSACSDMMNRAQMASFTEVLIRKKHYTEAAGFLAGVSPDSVDDKLLLELSEALVQYPENESSTELMNLLVYLFGKGILDDFHLQYLSRNYKGKKELLISLYGDCRGRKICCDELNQRLLLRLVMEEHADEDLIQEIFISTVNLEQSELLNQAVINRICHDYLCGVCEIEAEVMAALQSMIIHSGSVAGLTVPCQLACLKYDCYTGLNHDIEHIILKELCQNMLKQGMKLDFVQREAAEYELPAYPVLQANLSAAGDFCENLYDQVKAGSETVWAEYYVDGEPDRYRVELKPVYGCLFAAGIVMFAGEEIHYRFLCGDKATDWKTTEGWNYPTDQTSCCGKDKEAEFSYRYSMLQEIAVCLQNGQSAADRMSNYEKMLKLTDLIGK